MHGITFDIAHMLAGSLVLVSFMQLYQDRLYALLNTFALHALVLALSVAWQAYAQDAPHLYVTALIALVFKAIVIPVALHRIIVRLGIHRDIETVIGCLFVPWGITGPDASPRAIAIGLAAYVAKLAVGGFLLAVFETAIAKMRMFRVPAFLGAALMLGLLATLLLFVSRSL